jgi:fluoroacetyl-CoA thioesterase
VGNRGREVCKSHAEEISAARSLSPARSLQSSQFMLIFHETTATQSAEHLQRRMYRCLGYLLMSMSEPSLMPGIERTDEFTVEGQLVTDVGGTIEASVLSTPGMIAMMEGSAMALAYEHLPAGQATVGFEVCIKHVSAAAQGSRCHVRVSLRAVVDGRKLRFDVEVTEGGRTIGVGTHERRIIGAAQLGSSTV